MHLRNKILFAFALVAAFSGCVTTELPEASQHYDPNDSARIRLFGQNGRPSIMVVQIGQGADARSVKVNVGGGLGDAFGSLLLMSKNKSIGIAETESTRNLASRDGILSKAFYREFVIPAGKQVEVNNAFIGMSNVISDPVTGRTVSHQWQRNCISDTVFFTPHAGKDYEVGFINGKTCTAAVFEVQTIEGEVTLVPIQVQ
jgi:hypothetical protein